MTDQALQGNTFEIRCHWSKSRMSRCTAKVGAIDTTCTRPGTHSDQLLLPVWPGKSLLWSEPWSHHLRIGACVLRLPPMVWDSVPGSLVVCFALIMTLCCYCKMANAHPRENVQTILHSCNFLFLLACDDECVGVLLGDLDNVGDTSLSVNLTSIIPVPYGILSDLENTTKYLRVGTGNTEMHHWEIWSWAGQ